MFKLLLLSFWCLLATVQARPVERSELRSALINHGVPHSHLDTWECIVEHESHFETKAHNRQTGDHGIFQISEIYWCSTHGRGNGCNVNCEEMKSNDITAAVKCALTVFKQTERSSGNGFTAWVTYHRYCVPMSSLSSVLLSDCSLA